MASGVHVIPAGQLIIRENAGLAASSAATLPTTPSPRTREAMRWPRRSIFNNLSMTGDVTGFSLYDRVYAGWPIANGGDDRFRTSSLAALTWRPATANNGFSRASSSVIDCWRVSPMAENHVC